MGVTIQITYTTYLFTAISFVRGLIGLLTGVCMRLLRDLDSFRALIGFRICILTSTWGMACAGTPRIAKHVVKPARSSMNTTTTTTTIIWIVLHQPTKLNLLAI